MHVRHKETMKAKNDKGWSFNITRNKMDWPIY
jgi:hypothetical protein